MRKFIIVIMTVVMLGFTGCESMTPEEKAEREAQRVEQAARLDAEKKEQEEKRAAEAVVSIANAMDKLNNANEIEIRKKVMTMNNSYDIYIDDVLIGNVSGKYVTAMGDIFTFKTPDGHIIGSEKQIKRWGRFNRVAEIRGDDETVIGYIAEDKIKDLFSVGYRFHFYDVDKNEIGTTVEQVLSVKSTDSVYNADGTLAATVKSQFSIQTKDIITIEEGNIIPVTHLIYWTCIMDAIDSAEEEKKKEKKKDEE